MKNIEFVLLLSIVWVCILPSGTLGLNLHWRVVVCVDEISKFDSGVYKRMDVFFGRVN